MTRIEPSAFTRVSALGVDEQRVKVIASLDRPGQRRWEMGSASMSTHHHLAQRDRVLTVPASALFRDHDRWAVYAILAGRARLTPVQIGHRRHTDVEVMSGLLEGTPDRAASGRGDPRRDAGQLTRDATPLVRIAP